MALKRGPGGKVSAGLFVLIWCCTAHTAHTACLLDLTCPLAALDGTAAAAPGSPVSQVGAVLPPRGRIWRKETAAKPIAELLWWCPSAACHRWAWQPPHPGAALPLHMGGTLTSTFALWDAKPAAA